MYNMDTLKAIDSLHNSAMLFIEAKLKQLKILELNPVQLFILYCIGDRVLTQRDIIALSGHTGRNLSYSITKLNKLDYLNKEIDDDDKRYFQLSLTEKGIELLNRITDNVERYDLASSQNKILSLTGMRRTIEGNTNYFQ